VRAGLPPFEPLVAMFIGLIILLVLMLLCAVVGGIYIYIYFTRINPGRSRKYVTSGGTDRQTGNDEAGGGGGGAVGTHLFLFRKS